MGMIGSGLAEFALVAFFGASALALAGLTLSLRSSRLPDRGLRSFTALLALMALWSASAAGKIVAPVPVERLLVALELPLGVAFALLFFLFASQYTGRNWHRRRAFTACVVILILGLAVGLLTNPIHHLFWLDIAQSYAVFPHLVHEGLGPLYFAYVALAYVTFAAGVYALVHIHLRSRYNTVSVVLISFGGSIPLLINLVSVFDRAPIPGLDYTPVGLAVFGAVTTWSVQMDLFDIVPIARDTAVEQSTEGMVILDSDRRIRDFNPMAATLVPGLADHNGDPIETVVDGTAELFDATTPTTIELTRDGEATYLSTQTAAITDGPHRLGWTVTISDITERQRRERHLKLVSRVLRHNMANRINTITGHVDLLMDSVDQAQRDHLRVIDDSANSIIDTSVKLRTIQEIVTTGEASHATNVSRTVRTVVAKYQGRFPAATVTVDCPDDVFARCPPGFQSALDNLVENGLEHNPDPSPAVRVRVSVSDRLVHVRVADDGPGIPETERRILEAGETPLQHSSGVGLWLVYCFAEQSGHELTFERTETGGSAVRFSLDRTYPPGAVSDTSP